MGECDDFKGLCTVIRSSVEAVRRGALVALGMNIARGQLHGCDSRTRHMFRSGGSRRSLRGLLDFMFQMNLMAHTSSILQRFVIEVVGT